MATGHSDVRCSLLLHCRSCISLAVRHKAIGVNPYKEKQSRPSFQWTKVDFSVFSQFSVLLSNNCTLK